MIPAILSFILGVTVWFFAPSVGVPVIGCGLGLYSVSEETNPYPRSPEQQFLGFAGIGLNLVGLFVLFLNKPFLHG